MGLVPAPTPAPRTPMGARRAQVCFVTCRRWPDVSESDDHVRRALERRGIGVVGRPWNDASARFEGFDAVILRSNWDYHFEPDAFAAWLERWEGAGASIWNPPPLVRWNLSKRYLLDLDAAGVPIIPTVVLERPDDLPDIIAARGWDRAIVKPTVSASGHDTALVDLGTAPQIARALADGRRRWPAMVQPFIEAVRTVGEWSLVFIDGQFSHAAIKRPAQGDFRVQKAYGGNTAAATPPDAMIAAGHRVLRALDTAPMYARIDGVDEGGRFLLMELELNEPGLLYQHVPAAADVLAAAIAARISAA